MIKFENIYLKYNNKDVFCDFSLDINANEKVVLTAESGKGKSSLLKMLLGFVLPTDGKIYIEDMALEASNIDDIRSKLAYVSQDIDLEQETVKGIIDKTFSYKVNKKKVVSSDDIKKWLAYFELDQEILHKKIQDVSGGERQRVGLIICILLDRDIWLLDEVTSGLDQKMKIKVVDLLAETNKTMIIVSHDPVWSSRDCFRLEAW